MGWYVTCDICKKNYKYRVECNCQQRYEYLLANKLSNSKVIESFIYHEIHYDDIKLFLKLKFSDCIKNIFICLNKIYEDYMSPHVRLCMVSDEYFEKNKKYNNDLLKEINDDDDNEYDLKNTNTKDDLKDTTTKDDTKDDTNTKDDTKDDTNTKDTTTKDDTNIEEFIYDDKIINIIKMEKNNIADLLLNSNILESFIDYKLNQKYRHLYLKVKKNEEILFIKILIDGGGRKYHKNHSHIIDEHSYNNYLKLIFIEENSYNNYLN